MKRLLFDMDGVLLQSLGYHRALQETVRLVGRAIGYPNAVLTDDHIATFESQGVTCEWYSAALIVAYLYMLAKQQNYRLTFPKNLRPISYIHDDGELYLSPLFSTLEKVPIEGRDQLGRAVEVIDKVALQSGKRDDEYPGIVRNSGNVKKSVTFRTFQELVLGSMKYQEAYGVQAILDTKSYLSLYDVPLIDAAHRLNILSWRKNAGNFAAILTNRPSRQIPGTPSTPEAEIGAELVGLQEIPILGFGEIFWLSQRLGVESTGLNKPHPLHTLAALQAAVGTSIKTSMIRANNLLNGQGHLDNWSYLDGAEVYIFEDTVAGLISLDRAKEKLSACGISINTKKYGISPNKIKQATLSAQGARIFDSINPALDDALC
jgi:hypothetical protein